jgi:flagellar hook-basal body complex protein FliE
MSISIDPLAATAATSSGSSMIGGSVTAVTGETAAPFADLLTDAVKQVNQLENDARTTVDRLMTGSGVDVHQAMIATQKASMAFELALAVRNKAVQSYQTMMGMQF